MTDDADGGPLTPTHSGMEWWDDLVADAEDLAAEYEADGWDAITLHTGDVTALDGEHDDRVGLSVLVPDDEYARVESVLADAGVERYDAYRRSVAGRVALLLAVETTDETAILCPAYYERDGDAVEGMFDRAREAGVLRVYVRRLDQTAVVLELDDPDLLAPSE